MARLFVAVIVATLLTVLVTARGEKKSIEKRDITASITSFSDFYEWLCQVSNNGFTVCTASKTSTRPPFPPSTQRGQPGAGAGSSTTQASAVSETTPTNSSTPSDLELAHWCQYAANGSWIPYNFTFMHIPCVMCYCALNHQLLCNELQCMDLHCVDGTVPRKIDGQCCPQCAYETVSQDCRMNGITFPQGTRITRLELDVECWCQAGSIECRKLPATSTTSTVKSTILALTNDGYFSGGMTTYIIIIVICLVLMIGTLLCCGCALAYYYYYHTQQQNMQQAYEQYYNNAGWQPMGADGVPADEKEAEADQQDPASAVKFPTGQTPQYIPPPYAVHNGPYEGRPQGQQQV